MTFCWQHRTITASTRAARRQSYGGFSYGNAAWSARRRDGQEEAPIEPLSKERSLGGRAGHGVSGAFQLSGIVLLSFVLYAQPI